MILPHFAEKYQITSKYRFLAKSVHLAEAVQTSKLPLGRQIVFQTLRRHLIQCILIPRIISYTLEKLGKIDEKL